MTDTTNNNSNSRQHGELNSLDKLALVIPPPALPTSQPFPGSEENHDYTVKDFEMELNGLLGQSNNKSQQPLVKRQKTNQITPTFAKKSETVSDSDEIEDPEGQFQLKKSKSFHQRKDEDKDDKAYDPYEGLDHLTKVKVQADLGANHITPFNLVEYIQVLFNPQSQDVQKEIITVQQFNPSIRLRDEELKLESEALDKQQLLENYRSTCLKGHKLSMGICDEDYKVSCKFCNKVIHVGDQAYTCLDECIYYICRPCNLKHFVRHNLIHQTSQHHFYTPYQLEAVQENQRKNETKDEYASPIKSAREENTRHTPSPSLNTSDKLNYSSKSVGEVDKTNKRLVELEAKRKLGENVSNSTTTSMRFANIVRETKTYETQPKDFKKYVLIGLWHHKEGKYVCYRQLKIEAPTFVLLKRAEKTEEQFFHVGQNGDLCYFTKEKVSKGFSNIFCNFLDLKHAMSAPESEFEHCSSMLWRAPISHSVKFQAGSQAQSLLVNLLIETEQRVQPKAEFQILTSGDSQQLVVTCSLAFARDTKQWVETSYDNIHFINLQDPTNIFTIYDAQILLDVSTKDGKKRVLFLRHKSFVKMEWESPVLEAEMVQEFFESTTQPTQPYVKDYIFLPPPDNMSFSLQQDELDRTIDILSLQNSLKSGFVHHDNKRVSINYTSGGVFTFELADKAAYSKPSKWQGEVGQIKNFNFDSLIIDNQGFIRATGCDDVKGPFKVTGGISKNKLEWKGHQQDQGTKTILSFATFQIQEDGIVYANGSDLLGEFEITGSLDIDFRKAQFVKTYKSTGLQQFYEGKINQDQTKIVGFWGLSKANTNEEFFISISQQVDVEIKIQYGDSNTWILLKGILDQKLAEIEGTFTCSKDIEKFLLIDKRNLAKNTFYLTGLECRDRAIKLFSSTDGMQDARFCWVTKDNKKSLCVVGNMNLKPTSDQSIVGYKAVELTMIELDSMLLLVRKTKTKLTCQVPQAFQESYDVQGHPIKPYYIFMPFNIQYINDKKEISFQTQMVYHDNQQNARKLVFLQGTQKRKYNDLPELAEYKRDILLPQGPQPMSENYVVNYPILAYKSNQPMEKQIAICNLATNEPQKFISIDPFTFVEFVKTGLNSERRLNQEEECCPNISIFFLVELNQSFYLMNYRCFPWPIDPKLIDPLEEHRFQLQDQLQILSGKIQPSNFRSQINPVRISADKIQQAAMIQRAQSDGIQAMVVLQLVDEIICFNLAKPKYMERPQKDDSVKMLKINMLRGPNEQIYYGEENSGGLDQLVQLTFVEKDRVTTSAIYRSDNHRILSFTLAVNGSSGENTGIYPHFIYLLKSNQQLKRLSNSGADGGFVCDLNLDISEHPGTPQLMTQLSRSCWQSILIRDTDITSLQKPDGQDNLVAIVMSTKSELVQEIEMLGFDHDRTFSMLKEGRKNFNYKPSSVASMFQIPWIGKNVFQIQEASNNYFMIQNRLGTRKIGMMRLDQDETLKESSILIGNSYLAIKLKFANQYMLYDQKTFDFVSNYKAKYMQPITYVKDGVQYFASSNINSDNDKLDSVVKFDENGVRTLIYQNVKSQVENIQRQYLKDIHINFDKWNMQSDNENLLGFFAFAYSEKQVVPLSQKAQLNFCGESIYLNCYMINQEVNSKFDQKYASKASLSQSQFKPFSSLTKGGGTFQRRSTTSAVELMAIRSFTPTVFVIECDHWEKLERRQSRSTLFTKDYMVIKHHMHICYAKISDIMRANEQSQSQCIGDDCQTGPGRFQELFVNKKQCRVSFRFVNLDVLSKSHTKNDCSVIEVPQYDMLIAEKGESRSNAIQITFSELAIMWDLDENKEVTFLQKPEQFSNFTDYTATGFQPHVFKSEKRVMSNCKFFTQNEDRSLVWSPDTPSLNSQIMRTYAQIYLMDVKFLKQREAENLVVSKIDVNMMFQNFNDLTFFQIFRHKEEYFQIIVNQIKAEDILEMDVTDERGESADNIIIRKIYWTMNLPVVKSEADPSAFEKVLRPSILQSTMYEEKNQHMLSSFLRLIMLSKEYRLSDLVGNFECFKQVFEIQSKQIQTFLEESHIENQDCLEVKSCQWNEAHKMITFGSNYSLLRADQIKEEIRKQQMNKLSTFTKLMEKIKPSKDILSKDLKTFQVRVRIVEIEWLADNMQDLYMYLDGVTDDNMFGNEFIKILLESQDYKWQLSIKVFLPYVFFIIINVLYFSRFVPSIEVTGGFWGVAGERNQVGLRIVILLGCCLFGFIEMRQMKIQGASYITDFWNIIFWGSIVLNIVIVICHGCELMILNDLIMLASVASLFQWGILYYWMRLYPELAFYVTMISETLKDIKDFFIIFMMCIAMFSNAVYILNLMQPGAAEEGGEEPEPNEPLFAESLKEPFIDAAFDQYLIGLGEFNIEGYVTHPAIYLVHIYFILATLFTQIMFLNMLIAIMGQTFERVSEAKERTALMERTHLYADFMWGIKLSKDLAGMRYLYVVKPDEQDEEDQVSAIQEAQTKITELMKTYNSRSDDEIEHLQNKVNMILQSHTQMKVEMKDQMDQISKDINSKFDLLMAKIEK